MPTRSAKKTSNEWKKKTGKKAEDLTDEELEQAMDDLNIPKEEMTDEEWKQVEKADAEEDDYIEQLGDYQKPGATSSE